MYETIIVCKKPLAACNKRAEFAHEGLRIHNKYSITAYMVCMAPASVTMTAMTCTVTSVQFEVTWLKSGVHVNGGTAYQGFSCA